MLMVFAQARRLQILQDIQPFLTPLMRGSRQWARAVRATLKLA